MLSSPFRGRRGLYLYYICTMQHVKDDLQVRWLKLRIKLKERFGIKPDMDGILFLIGIQELGSGKQDFTKEQKQDLMHIAVCTVLSASGYYAVSGHDEDNWPHFEQLKPLPGFIMIEQENFLKDHILLYFQNQKFID
jgi:hypothetical protein